MLPPGADEYLALKPLNELDPSVLNFKVIWFIDDVITAGGFAPQYRFINGEDVDGPL